MRYSRRGRIENKVRQEALARMRQPKVSHRKAWVRVLVFVGLVVLCGVAINRPRKPQPLSRPQDVVLPYHVASSKDISYAGSRRLVRRVVLDVATRPEEPELRATATAIWTPDRNRWDEFTVFLYLSDMDTQSMAYAVAEYTPAGSAAFRVQEFALRGTRWKKTADPPEPPPRPMPASITLISMSPSVMTERSISQRQQTIRMGRCSMSARGGPTTNGTSQTPTGVNTKVETSR